ncbi:AzlD domain-containing protein [Virgibacillus dokdonensis]|uniref:AzlD domain-containing protein n=1 Tax=Virgibacillus dokdonensis TaxID=302167 RepID=A0ABU7VJ78_9BACI
MTMDLTLLVIVIFGTIVTFLPRSAPLMMLSQMEIPSKVIEWLEHIPIAVMTALVVQEVLIPNHEFTYVIGNLRLLAALPTILVALFTRSLLLIVIVAMCSMASLRFFF